MKDDRSGRIFFLDALRATAVMAVVWLHVCASRFEDTPVTGFEWQVFNVYDSLVRFCVPVFVMISGVFFLNNSKELTLKKLFSKYIKRIVLAFVIWSGIYALTDMASGILMHGRSWPDAALRFLRNFACGRYHLWYLFLITGLYLITPFVRMISDDKKLTEYFLVLSFVCCFAVNLLYHIPAPSGILHEMVGNLHLDFVMGYTGYYLLGYYLHNYELNRKTKSIIYALAAISLIFTIVVSGIWSYCTGEIHELYDYLLPNTFFEACAVFIFFKDHFPEKGGSPEEKRSGRIKTAVNAISTASFEIYLVHDLFIQLLTRFGLITTSFNPILSVPVISLIVFVLSLFSAILIRKAFCKKQINTSGSLIK